MVRYWCWATFIALFLIFGLVDAFLWRGAEYFLLFIFVFFVIFLYDIIQHKRNVLRNYPLIAHFRYLLLKIRPEIQQYFIETNQSGRPFDAESRELIARRAALHYTLDKFGQDRFTTPFGTQLDVYDNGYEWMNHSMRPTVLPLSEARVLVGGPQCTKPYLASRLNISAMSFGALSSKAVEALNLGAKIGGFAHNTGEGSLSPYHLKHGGDIIWQIGTAYFGCRTKDGGFDSDKFKEKATLDVVKMIEIKLSQGAKPAHGGVLPAKKITKEISEIRGVPMGEDCESPPAHKAFSTPIGLLEFVAKLRELSGGKPVGFKLCLGSPSEFMCICKAMLKTQIYPDFITIDGKEGGTGAAPVEFTDRLGTPLLDGLAFITHCLDGIDLKKHIKVIASGKIKDGFSLARVVALGADMCNSARGMLFSLGCIQSRNCNNNMCPTGITTQNKIRQYALNVKAKAPEVASYHATTVKSFLEVLGAAGVEKVSDMNMAHMTRRISTTQIKTYAGIYPHCNPGDLLTGKVTGAFAKMWQDAKAECFVSAKDVML